MKETLLHVASNDCERVHNTNPLSINPLSLLPGYSGERKNLVKSIVSSRDV